jgi:hypothetical protein
MSELTRCNYCDLRSIERGAKQDDMVITKLVGWKGGIDVFVHPSGAEITKKSQGDNHPHQKWFRAWFMSITDHCCC